MVAVSLMDDNGYYEPGRSTSACIEVLHSVSHCKHSFNSPRSASLCYLGMELVENEVMGPAEQEVKSNMLPEIRFEPDDEFFSVRVNANSCPAQVGPKRIRNARSSVVYYLSYS